MLRGRKAVNNGSTQCSFHPFYYKIMASRFHIGGQIIPHHLATHQYVCCRFHNFRRPLSGDTSTVVALGDILSDEGLVTPCQSLFMIRTRGNCIEARRKDLPLITNIANCDSPYKLRHLSLTVLPCEYTAFLSGAVSIVQRTLDPPLANRGY